MKFETGLIPGTLLKRYKRFLADIRLDSGEVITAHSPNTGAMTGCAEPGSRVWVRDTANPARKYPYAWELSTSTQGGLVGINTGRVNQLVSEAIEQGVITELQGYSQIRQEVKYGMENSRIDLLLQADSRPDCYVEIKNVTMLVEGHTAVFPDAVSQRATRHLRELIHVVEQGQRAVLFFCIQRADAHHCRPAHEIDAEYAQMLSTAIRQGVEVLAYKALVEPFAIGLVEPVSIRCE